MSGLTEVDQPRAMYLVELATELARTRWHRVVPLLPKCFRARVLRPGSARSAVLYPRSHS